MSCPNDLEFVLWGYLAGVFLVLIAIVASAIQDRRHHGRRNIRF